MELNYKIALINVFWSKNDINTRYFETIAEQKTYFDNLIEGKGFSPLSNFNMNDNTETIVTFTDESGRDAETLCKTNYAVVIKTDEDDGGRELSRRYYFAYSKQDSGKQMRTMLELDDIQTNYFPNKDKIETCMINRCHMNRWIDNGDGSVSFNGKVTSDLFEREDFQQMAKRIQTRSKLKLYSENENNNDFINFINKNVVCWLYVLVDFNANYNFVDENNNNVSNIKLEQVTTDKYFGSEITYPNAMLCVPIINHSSNALFVVDNIDNPSQYIQIGIKGLQNFIEQNSQYSYIYTMKLSIKPPFWFDKTPIYKYIKDSPNDSLIIQPYEFNSLKMPIYQTSAKSVLNAIRTTKETTQYSPFGVFQLTQDNLDPFLFETDLTLPKIKFEKNEIINQNRKIELNPKLNSEDFKSLNITMSGSEFSFDLQKLNKEKIIFEYIEPIVPDITKAILRLHDGSEDDVFNEYYCESFNGLIINNDYSLPIANTQFAQYLANNKNAYLSFQNQQDISKTSAIVGAIGGMVGGVSSKSASSIFQTGLNFYLSEYEIQKNQVQFHLSIDNMKNAPSSLQNANGSAILSSAIADFGIYVEYLTTLPIETKIADDIMNLFGYSYSQFGKVSDFDNIRKYFNYISANVETITADISDKEKERLKEKLKSVRFWNSDNIDFSKENYERWLEA